MRCIWTEKGADNEWASCVCIPPYLESVRSQKYTALAPKPCNADNIASPAVTPSHGPFSGNFIFGLSPDSRSTEPEAAFIRNSFPLCS